MKIRGSVVSLSLIFPHPPEDKKKTKKRESVATKCKCGECGDVYATYFPHPSED